MLFKDVLRYSIKSIDKLLILGLVIVIAKIPEIFNGFNFLSSEILESRVLFIILSILALAASFIAYGYYLSITRNTIHNVYDGPPELDLKKNIVDGVKYFVLNIVYFIIPILVTVIIAFSTGAVSIESINSISESILVSSSSIFIMPLLTGLTLLESILTSSSLNFIILLLVGLILFIVFGLVHTLAKAVLADTGSLTTASNMPKVFKKITKIGWKNYIIWIIVYSFIAIMLSIFISIISAIDFIGLIIAPLVIIAFKVMFTARSVGLIYNESKK